MRLTRLELSNIRSYTSQTISFPSGSVLLAGDIGSGKSTLLLAIEFALFGLKIGELTGGALLRHGAREGKVALGFSVGGHSYTVTRTLRRGKDRISQHKGSLTTDGTIEDLMPTELKSRIYGILRYPLTQVGKAQDLLWRYTVYTPQEQMKQILLEDRETRLETLRKVFDLDRYKRIRENAGLYARTLRVRGAELRGKSEGLEEQEKQAKALVASRDELEDDLAAKKRIAAEAEAALKKREAALEKFAKALRKEQEKRLELSRLDEKLAQTIARRAEEKAQAETLQKDIEAFAKTLTGTFDPTTLRTRLAEKENALQATEKSLFSVREERAALSGTTTNLREGFERMKGLSACPLCKQDVPHDHKRSVLTQTNERITALQERASVLKDEEEHLAKELGRTKKGIAVLQGDLQKALIAVERRIQIDEKKSRLSALADSQERAKKTIAEINTAKAAITLDASLSTKHEKVNVQAAAARRAERAAAISFTAATKGLETMSARIAEADARLTSMKEARTQLTTVLQLTDWLSGTFSPLAGVIEKHVLSSVHQEFSGLLEEWFSMLVADDRLSVRLDDAFTVIVEQDGHETSVEHLSGGERTSIALAYRLALNRVVSDLVSQIQTKGLLILDEPTEGFSSEQLDCVRDVLAQTGSEQTLIVSHEGKIESYVDSVLRIHKENGVSSCR